MRTHIWGVAAAGVVAWGIATSACARHRTTLASGAALAPASDSIYLEIENHNWSDVEIFINHDGRVDRVTQVTAAKNLTLVIPPHMRGETRSIRIIARRIGGRDTYTSPLISLSTGTTVRFTIESSLVRSSVGVW
jgi:hypothetical protein